MSSVLNVHLHRRIKVCLQQFVYKIQKRSFQKLNSTLKTLQILAIICWMCSKSARRLHILFGRGPINHKRTWLPKTESPQPGPEVPLSPIAFKNMLF